MKNNIIKIKDSIMEKMKDYRFYNYEIPYSIFIVVKHGVINTNIMRGNISSKVVDNNIKILVEEQEFQSESNKRIKEDINTIVRKCVTVDENIELYINPIDYTNFPNALEKYLNDYCHTKSIEPNTLSNIINSMPNKLNKAYMRSYNFDKKNVINYLLYSELNKVLNVHYSKQHFEDYILTLIQKLDLNDFKIVLEALNADEEVLICKDKKVDKLDYKEKIVDAYIVSTMLGKINDENKDENMITKYKNTFISSL